ncbi:Crotonobetainyl-CoA:carnitine CoA-transferase CaiB [Collimonas sp. OK607]|uniref:CaiB/BaiF CoA transferase family protein n=1 Tax=Collimonas sp. OK607 TaxID=1798194 RepID=UPI0008EA7ADC|nr:CaiB/BaiF CoA-transferase family protein [Collimonas sp. OK607]SFA82757.1 Crotonobetainyl-CoA:carnitine CoA-transferase CaiB [Collimonas sp. OK607]
MNKLPLSNFMVIDLTIARAGPTAVRLLADWGANIIRIEAPSARADGASVTGVRRNADEQNLHRNKRSLCIDLKHPKGAALMRELVAKADVVVENFRSSVKRRLGMEYEQLRDVNPRIILASISGFGQDGPYRDRPGVDQIVQGMSGLMSITGEPGQGPMRTGIAISDTTAGMFLGQGILLALLHRERTGEGQWVHTSLIESMLSKLDFQGARYTMNNEIATQHGNSHPTLIPIGTYESSDALVNICATTDKMWANLCDALGANALFQNQAYKDRSGRAASRTQLDADINAVTRQFTASQLIERLNAVGVPCGPIYNIGQAFEDIQTRHLRMTRPAPHPTLGDIELVRSPINLSGFPHPERFERAGPNVGEHTDALLREFGYDENAIQDLKNEGAVA